MGKEGKRVIELLLFVLPLFVVMAFGWLRSPMYVDSIAEQRANYQGFLLRTYYERNPNYDREAIIDYYGFTDEDINPEKFLRNWTEAR